MKNFFMKAMVLLLIATKTTKFYLLLFVLRFFDLLFFAYMSIAALMFIGGFICKNFLLDESYAIYSHLSTFINVGVIMLSVIYFNHPYQKLAKSSRWFALTVLSLIPWNYIDIPEADGFGNLIYFVFSTANLIATVFYIWHFFNRPKIVSVEIVVTEEKSEEYDKEKSLED